MGDSLRYHPYEYCQPYLRQGLPLSWSSPISLNWLVNGSQDSSGLYLPVLEWQAYTTRGPASFQRVLSIELCMALSLARQALSWLSYFPNPNPLFLISRSVSMSLSTGCCFHVSHRLKNCLFSISLCRVFSEEPSDWSLFMIGVILTVGSTKKVEINVSTVGFRSASPWGCLTMVSGPWGPCMHLVTLMANAKSRSVGTRTANGNGYDSSIKQQASKSSWWELLHVGPIFQILNRILLCLAGLERRFKTWGKDLWKTVIF